MAVKQPGRIVRMRVTPKDCMSIVDILLKLGKEPAKYSFDAACRIALTATLSAFRKEGLIPDRDGFDYARLMEPFVDRSQAEINMSKETATRLNAAMFESDDGEEDNEGADEKISALNDTQRTIEERCTLDPFNHPDAEDIRLYAETVRKVFELQGVDCPMNETSLMAYAIEQLPKRRTV